MVNTIEEIRRLGESFGFDRLERLEIRIWRLSSIASDCTCKSYFFLFFSYRLIL